MTASKREKKKGAYIQNWHSFLFSLSSLAFYLVLLCTMHKVPTPPRAHWFLLLSISNGEITRMPGGGRGFGNLITLFLSLSLYSFVWIQVVHSSSLPLSQVLKWIVCRPVGRSVFVYLKASWERERERNNVAPYDVLLLLLLLLRRRRKW